MSEISSPASSPDAGRSAAAVIVAAGAGRRLGGEVRKQYLELLGKPVLLRAVAPFLNHPRIGAVVVVLPPEDAEAPPEWLRELSIRIVAGGAERADSVWNGLRATPPDTSPLLVHDGARPFVTHEMIDRVLAAAHAGGAIAAIPVADTLKEVDANGQIYATRDRAHLWQAQTPQGFPRSLLISAYQALRAEGAHTTDDAAVIERYGGSVHVVEGAATNIKITRPADLILARALAQALGMG